MNEELDLIPLYDLIQDNNWNGNNLNHVFGSNFDMATLNLGTIDIASDNHSIWNPRANSTKISAVVYHHLNHKYTQSKRWSGWHILWRILVVPRVKHLLWLVAYQLQTFSIEGIWILTIPAFYVAFPRKPLIIFFVSAPKFIWFGPCSVTKLTGKFHFLMALHLVLGLLIAIIQCTSFLSSL